MREEQKEMIMRKTFSELDSAKHNMADAADILEENGLAEDAEALMNMVYRLEQFQNKYSKYSIWNA